LRKSIILAGSALAVAAVVGTAGPALASGSPVNVSASVNSNTTLTGITGAITFPAGNAGDTKTVLHAEQYTASSNSAAGYALTISPSSDHMAGPGGAALDNSNLQTTTSVNGGAGTMWNWNAENGGFEFDRSAPSTDTFSEDWSLMIPANQAAGAYTETWTYLLVAN